MSTETRENAQRSTRTRDGSTSLRRTDSGPDGYWERDETEVTMPGEFLHSAFADPEVDQVAIVRTDGSSSTWERIRE